VAIAILVVAACTLGAETPGRGSKEALVEAYLVALQASDSKAMLSLVDPRVEAGAEVAEALEEHGGVPLKDVTVSYLDEFGGSFIVATVKATNAIDGSSIEFTIPIGRADDRFQLALGLGTPTGSEANPASPSPAAP
jgi:hypothetical protein